MDKQHRIRYKGKFISQKKYEKIMRIIKIGTAYQERRKMSNESKADGLIADASDGRSKPGSAEEASRKEESRPSESSEGRAVKRKASPARRQEESVPAKRGGAIDKRNLENSPDQSNKD